MAAQTPGELLEWLAESQFLPPPQVEEMRTKLTGFADRHALTKELVRRNWLTPFQANQLLTDKAGLLVLGPYRMLERIGEGAMGQVLKAWHVRLGKFVAVKMVHQKLVANAKAMDRFRQEMQTAAQLRHPNIVLVRDAGDVDNRPYMEMEYCEGTNLAHVVKKQGALSVHLACDYIRQAALGLQHAAEQGVVHRDIKPSNLLLTKAAPHQPAQVKILDFGLARVTTMSAPGRLTTVGNLLGTIDYIAPEQIENAQNADVRSDIYSLGCTLFFLLTARPPFTGANVMEKVSNRLMGQMPDILEARPEVPAALDTVLRRILAQRPKDRYQTAAELADALAPFCTARAVLVAPGSVAPAATVPHGGLITAVHHQAIVPTVLLPEPKPSPAPVQAAAPPVVKTATAIPTTVSNTTLLKVTGGSWRLHYCSFSSPPYRPSLVIRRVGRGTPTDGAVVDVLKPMLI